MSLYSTDNADFASLITIQGKKFRNSLPGQPVSIPMPIIIGRDYVQNTTNGNQITLSGDSIKNNLSYL